MRFSYCSLRKPHITGGKGAAASETKTTPRFLKLAMVLSASCLPMLTTPVRKLHHAVPPGVVKKATQFPAPDLGPGPGRSDSFLFSGSENENMQLSDEQVDKGRELALDLPSEVAKVGSQGDGSAQLVCRSESDQELSFAILRTGLETAFF